jgi:hypothetical protein
VGSRKGKTVRHAPDTGRINNFPVPESIRRKFGW